MKKQDVEVFRRAVELAASGNCADWKDIQARLVDKGFRRAPDLLDGQKIRAILDAQCALNHPRKKSK